VSVYTIMDSLRDWVVGVTNLGDEHVIFARPDGQRPTKPYATLLLLSLVRMSGDDVAVGGELGGGATVEVTGQRRATVSLQLYGEGSYDYAEEVLSAIVNPVWQESARSEGFVVGTASAGDLGAMLDTEWEERCGLDLAVDFAISETIVNGISTIEHAEATGALNQDVGDAVEVVVTADQ